MINIFMYSNTLICITVPRGKFNRLFGWQIQQLNVCQLLEVNIAVNWRSLLDELIFLFSS